MAGLVDWLLAEGAGSRERFVPVTYEVPNGLPLVWRWTGAGAPQDAALSLWEGGRERRDTLRFDAGGRAELRLAPGVYRYAAAAPPSAGGGERGLVAVEMYSDEWRPAGAAAAPPAARSAPRAGGGGRGGRGGRVGVGGGRAAARAGWGEPGVGRGVSTGVLPTRKGLRVFRAVLRDASGLLECAWPGQPFLERQIKKGQLLLATGPVRYYHGRQLVPREFVILADEGEEGPEGGMVLPVYPATEGLTHRPIRSLIQQHLDALRALADDPHPQA